MSIIHNCDDELRMIVSRVNGGTGRCGSCERNDGVDTVGAYWMRFVVSQLTVSMEPFGSPV